MHIRRYLAILLLFVSTSAIASPGDDVPRDRGLIARIVRFVKHLTQPLDELSPPRP
jgi:hypothetical protein